MKFLIHLAVLASLGWAPHSYSATFSETSLAYRYGSHFTEPARPDDITKNIVTLTHLRNGDTGIHFLSLEGRFSDEQDPAKDSTQGAREYLAFYRYQLPAGKVLDKPISFGPIRDLAFTVGADLTDKNTLFAPQKRALVAGPVIKFDVPGFLDIGLLSYLEQNHKGIPNTPRPNIQFDNTWMISATWGIPVSGGNTPVVFQGLFNRLGAKGNDFNNQPTAAETLLRTALMFDVSQPLGLRRKSLFVGFGYEWWQNKYGNQTGTGTSTSTATLNCETFF